MTVIPPAPSELPAAHSAAQARAQQRYWRYNLILIAVLCVIGGAVSFILPMFAPSLAQLYFLGWSLPYYMGAQGAILIYVLLICVYVILMQRADRILQHALQADALESSVAATGEPRA